MALADKAAPTTKVIDWAKLVREAWGPAYNEPDTAYQFSNGREFKSSDASRGGIYTGTAT